MVARVEGNYIEYFQRFDINLHCLIDHKYITIVKMSKWLKLTQETGVLLKQIYESYNFIIFLQNAIFSLCLFRSEQTN